MKCKERASDFIFDAMLWDGDTVILRQSVSYPTDLFIVSLDLFAEKFAAIGD